MTNVKPNPTAVDLDVLAKALDFSSDAIYLLDAEGVVVSANKAIETIYGYERKDIIGRPVTEIVTIDDGRDLDGIVENYRLTGQGGLSGAGPIQDILVRPDGTKIHVETVVEGLSVDGAPHLILSVRDITEKVEAQTALNAEREKWQLLLRNSSDLVTIMQPDGMIIFEPPGAIGDFSDDEAPLVGRNAFDFAHPDDSHRLQSDLLSMAECPPGDGGIIQGRFRFAGEDWRHIELRVRNFIDHPEIGGLLVGSRDITPMVNAIEEVNLREQLLMETQQVGKIATWELDLNTGLVDWSGYLSEYFGDYKGGAGPSVSDLEEHVHVDDREEFLAVLTSLADDPQMVVEVDYRFTVPGIGRRYFHSTAMSVPADEGKGVRIRGITRDNTEEVEVNTRLAESVARLREAQILSGTGYWTLDLKTGRIIFSDELKEIMGWTEDTAPQVYQDATNLVHPDDVDVVGREMERAREAGGVMEYDHRMKTASGEWKWLRERGQIAIGEDGRPEMFEGVTMDITSIKESESNLQQAIIEAEASSKAKSDFLANMSHELRTPLNAVIGFTSILKDQSPSEVDPEKYGQYLELIQQSGEHLLNIINDVLDLSKIEAGRMLPKFEWASGKAVVEQSVAMVAGLKEAESSKITIESVEEGSYILVDTQQLTQVLVNLMTNAVKFSDKGQPITVRLINDDRGGLSIQVEDHGVGMSAEQIEEAYEPFVQIEATYTKSVAGTGLGLAIARNLVELNGGTFFLESEAGKGTVATVHFPADKLSLAG